MKLTTTLQRIKDAHACTEGYKKLATYLGGCKAYGMDTPINLLTILESNGLQDMLWCLRATVEDSKRTSSQLAIEFAAEALPIFEARYPNDARPRQAIQAARDYLDGKITLDEFRKARAAAADAADAAYADADAAYAAYAAYAAAYATYAAAADAAADADARSKAKQRQLEIIRSILEA